MLASQPGGQRGRADDHRSSDAKDASGGRRHQPSPHLIRTHNGICFARTGNCVEGVSSLPPCCDQSLGLPSPLDVLIRLLSCLLSLSRCQRVVEMGRS
jgi:hypothetical protein